MTYKYVWLFVLLVVLSTQKQLKQSKIVKAVNCGMKEGTIKSEDIKYQSDANYVVGKSVDVDYHSDSNAQEAEIKYAIDKEIYMFERHTYSEMTYSLPVRTGVHTIILKFAEMYFQSSGQRVFNIKIGNTIVVENIDVFAKSGGKYAAYEEYIEVQVKNGDVFYKGIQMTGGIKNGQIQITFSKGKADNPIVQGIIIYQGPISETTYEDYAQMKKNWGSHQELIKARKEDQKIKERLQEIKKKQKIVIRNDQLLIEETGSDEDVQVKKQKFGMIRSFLMSPIGILIWAAIFGWQIIFLYNKFFMLGRTENSQQIQHEHRD